MLTLASAWMKREENVLRETPQTPWDSRTGGQREGPGAVSPTLGPRDTRRRRARGRGRVSATTRCSGFNKTEFLSYAGVCTRAPWAPLGPFLSGCDCALEPALRPAGTSSPPRSLFTFGESGRPRGRRRRPLTRPTSGKGWPFSGGTPLLPGLPRELA